MSLFWEHKMFSILSEFQCSDNHSPFFTNLSIELFPDTSFLNDDKTLPLNIFNARKTDDQPMVSPERSSSSADSVSPSTVPISSDVVTPRVRRPPSYLHDYHCYSTIVSLHEPSSYREASTNPLWQQAMQEELQALSKTYMLSQNSPRGG